jgi:hypothetical protein
MDQNAGVATKSMNTLECLGELHAKMSFDAERSFGRFYWNLAGQPRQLSQLIVSIWHTRVVNVQKRLVRRFDQPHRFQTIGEGLSTASSVMGPTHQISF